MVKKSSKTQKKPDLSVALKRASKQAPKTIVKTAPPNEAFFSTYGDGVSKLTKQSKKAAVFLMRHAVSSLNEKLRLWKRRTGFRGWR